MGDENKVNNVRNNNPKPSLKMPNNNIYTIKQDENSPDKNKDIEEQKKRKIHFQDIIQQLQNKSNVNKNDKPEPKKYEKKFGDIQNSPEKEDQVKKKLMDRLNRIRSKSKSPDNENTSKFKPFKKSEFIGEKAKMLQQQIEKNYNENNNSNKTNKTNKSIYDTKSPHETIEVNEIINSKPVSRKKKKSRMLFVDEDDFK